MKNEEIVRKEYPEAWDSEFLGTWTVWENQHVYGIDTEKLGQGSSMGKAYAAAASRIIIDQPWSDHSQSERCEG